MDVGRRGTGSYQSTGSLASSNFSPSESLGFSPFAIHDGLVVVVKDRVHVVVMTLPIDDVDAPSSVLSAHDVDGVVVYKYEACREDGRCHCAAVDLQAAARKDLERRRQ